MTFQLLNEGFDMYLLVYGVIKWSHKRCTFQSDGGSKALKGI